MFVRKKEKQEFIEKIEQLECESAKLSRIIATHFMLSIVFIGAMIITLWGHKKGGNNVS